MNCTNCGTALGEGASVCGSCGTAVVVAAQDVASLTPPPPPPPGGAVWQAPQAEAPIPPIPQPQAAPWQAPASDAGAVDAGSVEAGPVDAGPVGAGPGWPAPGTAPIPPMPQGAPGWQPMGQQPMAQQPVGPMGPMGQPPMGPMGQPPMGPMGQQQMVGGPVGWQPGMAMAPGAAPIGADKKMSAGILGILLGAFGVHKFILGYKNEGLIMLIVSIVGIVLSCLVIPFLATMAMGLIGLVEGIIYLTKSDEEFSQTYVVGRKPWF